MSIGIHTIHICSQNHRYSTVLPQTQTHMHTHMHTHTQTHRHTHAHTRARTHTHTHTHTHTQTQTHKHMHPNLVLDVNGGTRLQQHLSDVNETISSSNMQGALPMLGGRGREEERRGDRWSLQVDSVCNTHTYVRTRTCIHTHARLHYGGAKE